MTIEDKITRVNHATQQADLPKTRGNNAFLGSLRSNPLPNKPKPEDQITGPADDLPGVYFNRGELQNSQKRLHAQPIASNLFYRNWSRLRKKVTVFRSERPGFRLSIGGYLVAADASFLRLRYNYGVVKVVTVWEEPVGLTAPTKSS